MPTPDRKGYLEGLNVIPTPDSGSEFVAVGPGEVGIDIWRTRNGRAWNIDDLPGAEANWAYATALGPSGLVVAGEKSIASGGEPPRQIWALPEGRLWHSADGRDWTMVADEAFAGAVLRDVAASALGYVAVGSYARVRLPDGELYAGQEPVEGELIGKGALWYSGDGAHWDRIDGFPDGASPWRVLATATGFLVIGTALEETDIGVWSSGDGRHWTYDAVRPRGLTDVVGSLRDVTHTPWGYLGVSTVVGRDRVDGRLWLSADGLEWSQVPWDPGVPQPQPSHVEFGPAGPLIIGTTGGMGEEVPILWRLAQ
jgi:hypothetical protein